MGKPQDRETRYFIDLDLKAGIILGWGYDQRVNLVQEQPVSPFHHRIYISKGQYNKLDQKALEVMRSAGE